ncbi:MAG: hypothetical protein V4644_01430 [Patescibacteria group bacterium]
MSETLLASRLAEAGLEKSEPRRRWDHAKTRQRSTMSWNHDALGEIIIGVKNYDIGNTDFDDGYSWAPVRTRSKSPGELRLSFAMNLGKDVVSVFQARGSTVEQCSGTIPELRVPVSWDSRGRPTSRKRDEDNLDHFLVTDEGIILQLQTSVLTRGDVFYVSNHELWAGQIVEVTEESPSYRTVEVAGKRYAVNPFWDTQAYPGADFLVTNATTGRQVIELALADGLVPPVVDSLDIPAWDPPSFPREDGYQGAIVLWFNPNVGAKVFSEDGEHVFVPLKGIHDFEGRNVMKRGQYPIVTPKQQVLLRKEMIGDTPLATIKPAH